MSISIRATIDQIQTELRAVARLKKAPALADYPERINAETDLPLAFAWPAGGTWDWQGIGGDRDDERYAVTVLIAPAGKISRAKAAVQATLLLDDLRDHFLTEAAQSLSNTVDHIGPITHQGLRIEIYAGDEYYGFQLTLTVTEKES